MSTPTTTRLIRPRSYEETVAAVRDCGARGGIAGGGGAARGGIAGGGGAARGGIGGGDSGWSGSARGGLVRGGLALGGLVRGGGVWGAGWAPGDAARCAGGAVLDMTGLDRVHAVDAVDGTVLCDAGLTLHRLAEALLPLGWLPPVLPASAHTTVGAAIATDAHGHDHPVSGAFSRHVLALELLTADGRIVSALPGTDLFDATTGGLGLTGVILTATLRLQPVRTPFVRVRTEHATDLDDLLARMTPADHRYTTARLDPLARGGAVLLHADPVPPPGRRTTGVLDALRHRAAPGIRTTGRLRHVTALPHLLDAPAPIRLAPWRYGGGGVVRYRFAVPYGQEETLRRIVRRISGRRRPPSPALLTRLGEADAGWLSFPVPGWSLAVDLPTGRRGLPALLDTLDEEVARAGGRVCLARDSRLRPDLLAAMYPRLADFRALRAALDPRGVFTSDLSRRLAL
ncbi:FAD-binding oxidoreductase [Streptomyces flavalbus]|uniref:FAD-binding oxidoreductase n=1 Tax=Streptomyces flavalbus TaxID=2665155 RepID=A0ABW2WGF9_9ACTN